MNAITPIVAERAFGVTPLSSASLIEPASQSSQSGVPIARRLGGVDNLLADCCFGSEHQHAEGEPCPVESQND